MTPIEALEIALDKESEAIDFYKEMSVEHSAIAELSNFLMNEEEKHKKMIEEKISKLKSS